MFCFQKEVNFLGEIVNDKGVMTTPEKNRDNVKRFAEIIEPLHKKSEYKWTDQHQDAFKSWKILFCMLLFYIIQTLVKSLF